MASLPKLTSPPILQDITVFKNLITSQGRTIASHYRVVGELDIICLHGPAGLCRAELVLYEKNDVEQHIVLSRGQSTNNNLYEAIEDL